MKRFLIIILICFVCNQAIARYGTTIDIYGGAGIAKTNNYDVGISGGIDFYKGIAKGIEFGGTVLYQGYSLYYDRETQLLKNGEGYEGVTVRNKSNYVFLCPKLNYFLDHKGQIYAYVTAGAGFNMGGTETLHKWDNSHNTPLTANQNFDSTINTSSNITKMLFRFSFGLSEYFYYGKRLHFLFRQDVGFLSTNLSSTANADNPSRTAYSPNNLSPVYFSFQIGIMYYK